MALITFLSDFGDSDHYVAAVKAKIYGLNPELQIFDISHNIARFNLAHGSYVLKAIFKSFPEGTVHLATINASSDSTPRFIAVKLDNHIFVGPDNGLISLVSEHQPDEIVFLPYSGNGDALFPEREVLSVAAAKLAQGVPMKEVGQSDGEMKRLINKQARATKQRISGSVIHVDHYGNLITNIEYRDFEILSKGRKYAISYGRNSTSRINENIAEVVGGESFHIFNSLGLLEIGINMGNGSELLGLEYDSPVHIIFED